MIERWKDIDGYEGYYQVSNFGEVRTVGHKYQRKGFHKIKLHNNRNGYWLADLHKNNLYKSKAIHRLVAKAFLPNPNNFPEVNHIDGNKANNCVDNLEWVSKSQNKWHACNVLGQRTNRIKDFSTGIVFPSQKSAALYYGVSESLIRSIVKKQIFSKRKKKQEITNHRIEIISEREYIDSLNKSELVDVINTLVKENNIHEKQIDELQMKAEPEKCKAPADPYAEQRKCICKLCWFWNDNKADKVIGILTGVFDEADRPFERNINQTLYKHCEPVKPDDSIIYRGK